MTPKRTEDTKYPEMLDAILKGFVTMSDDTAAEPDNSPPINWQALSDAIPDTDPEMCRKRFSELRSRHILEREQGDCLPSGVFSSSRSGSNTAGDPLYEYVQTLFKKDEKERKRVEKAKKRAEQNKKQKQEYDETGNVDTETRSTMASFPSTSSHHQSSKIKGGPSMVIHVCDEAKNLKQDFTCPRDLLIQEMRYFAEYLSVDSQRLEEVDISVHCDIHIFDWLMRYVKRNSGLVDSADNPKLEPSNVVSILISSDFLKMDSLVEECIGYCHDNLSQIVSTPCNMNCVNEKLTERIAGQFTHTELEDVKDRKDKFKSKLFCRKIEKLFDASTENRDSPGSAATLFKCKYCGRVLTSEQKDKMPCTNTRMCIDSRGTLTYEHKANKQWDVSNFILNLHEDLKKWGLVYWRLWGIVNHLTCTRCEQTFQLSDFGNCQYHAERPQFRQLLDMQVTDNAVGIYPCCSQRVLRFDPTGISKGCRLRDHVVTVSSNKQQKLLDELQTYKNLIKTPNQTIPVSSDLNIFSAEESTCGILEPTSTPAEIMPSPPPPIPQPKLSPVSIKVQRTVSPSDQYYTGLADNSEEDTGEEESTPKLQNYKQTSTSSHMSSISSRSSSLSDVKQATNTSQFSVAITPSAAASKITSPVKKLKARSPQNLDETAYGKFPSKMKWEGARSIRWNQDVQREEDMKRLQDMTTQLTRQRFDKGDKPKTRDSREFPGGIFSKLEVNFYANLRSNSGVGSGRQPGGNSNRDNRMRGRQSQVRF